MSKTIPFKSVPRNWINEFIGNKSNTVRINDDKDDYRFDIIREWMAQSFLLYIEIWNTYSKDFFVREVKDITVLDTSLKIFEGTPKIYVISWG